MSWFSFLSQDCDARQRCTPATFRIFRWIKSKYTVNFIWTLSTFVRFISTYCVTSPRRTRRLTPKSQPQMSDPRIQHCMFWFSDSLCLNSRPHLAAHSSRPGDNDNTEKSHRTSSRDLDFFFILHFLLLCSFAVLTTTRWYFAPEFVKLSVIVETFARLLISVWSCKAWSIPAQLLLLSLHHQRVFQRPPVKAN